MEIITYQQASEILGCKYRTISMAIMTGRLTKCLTPRGPRVIRQQVELFINKHEISERFLSLKEQEQWKKYKEIAEKGEIPITQNRIESILERAVTQLEKHDKANQVAVSCIAAIIKVLKENNLPLPQEIADLYP
jgi:hypothetical protein